MPKSTAAATAAHMLTTSDYSNNLPIHRSGDQSSYPNQPTSHSEGPFESYEQVGQGYLEPPWAVPFNPTLNMLPAYPEAIYSPYVMNTSTQAASIDEEPLPWEANDGSRQTSSEQVKSKAQNHRLGRGVSIDDIVEKDTSGSLNQSLVSRLKRKADTMEDFRQYANRPDEEQQQMPISVTASADLEKDGKKDHTPALSTEQPPKKKARMEKATPSLTKYATISAVSAIVGAATMFGALLALPQDFFPSP